MPARMSVFLNVHDLARSVKFYEALGFRVDNSYESDGEPAYADLSMGEAELGLGQIDSNDDPGFREWVSTPLGAGVLITVLTDEPDAVHERAVAAGADIESPPKDRPYGRAFTMNDPDGYSITFLREPAA